MIKDYRTAEQRLKRKNKKNKSEDRFDWWSVVTIALTVAFMYLFVEACLFWIDYAIIRLNGF